MDRPERIKSKLGYERLNAVALTEVKINDVAWLVSELGTKQTQLADLRAEIEQEYLPEHRIHSLLLAVRAYNPIFARELRKHIQALEEDRGRERIRSLEHQIEWLIEWHRIWHLPGSLTRWFRLTYHKLRVPTELKPKLNPPRYIMSNPFFSSEVLRNLIIEAKVIKAVRHAPDPNGHYWIEIPQREYEELTGDFYDDWNSKEEANGNP